MAQYVIPEQKLRRQAAADGITHLTTGVAVVRGGKVLVLRREPNDYPGGMYELPGGGVDDGETFVQAATREVLEEAGLTVQSIIGMFAGFDYATPKKPKARQFNFLAVVEDGEPVLSPEHDALAWVDEHNLDGLAITSEMKQCVMAALAAAQKAGR